ncbi:MAG: hypothetical protein Q4G65_10245 [bacterium]|nr:hypothetical protein [bacterium]
MADENSFVSFVCVSCRQELEAPRDMVGQTVECPSCGARLVVMPPEETNGTASQAQADAMKSRTIRIELGDI